MLVGKAFFLKSFYPPTQKTTPVCRNYDLPDAWMEHFGVQARALPVDECVIRASIGMG